MNDLGTLATQIVSYGFQDDTGTYPVTYVSGWLDANIGALNALTRESFTIDLTGAFDPSLNTTEESIFSHLFEISYYSKASRDALRILTYGGGVSDWISLKEGDTSIQRTNKNSVSRSFLEFSKDAQNRLDDILTKYLNGKAEPVQVAGDDGYVILQ